MASEILIACNTCAVSKLNRKYAFVFVNRHLGLFYRGSRIGYCCILIDLDGGYIICNLVIVECTQVLHFHIIRITCKLKLFIKFIRNGRCLGILCDVCDYIVFELFINQNILMNSFIYIFLNLRLLIKRFNSYGVGFIFIFILLDSLFVGNSDGISAVVRNSGMIFRGYYWSVALIVLSTVFFYLLTADICKCFLNISKCFAILDLSFKCDFDPVSAKSSYRLIVSVILITCTILINIRFHIICFFRIRSCI